MRTINFLLVLGSILIFSCQPQSKKSDESIATMYFGVEIITMEDDSTQYAEALVEKDGNIWIKEFS